MASGSTGITDWFTCPLVSCPVKLPLQLSVEILDDRHVVTEWGAREQVITLTASVKITNMDALLRHLEAVHPDVVVPKIRGLGVHT